MKLANTFRIGCDPEFVFVGADGLQVSAYALSVSLRSRAYGSSGTDSGGVCELRPAPSLSSYQLTANLRYLIAKLAKDEAIAKLQWRAGAVFRWPSGLSLNTEIGGHIHFEKTNQKVWWTAENRPWGTIRKVPCECGTPGCITEVGPDVMEAIKLPVGQALIALTTELEELEIHPKAETRQRARPGHYGDIHSSFRPGARPTVEFRKMCSWLWHPKVAFASLTLAKLVVCNPEYALEALKGQTDFAKLQKLCRKYTDADEDAARLNSTLLKDLKTLQADHKQNFLPRWLAWKPEEDVPCAD